MIKDAKELATTSSNSMSTSQVIEEVRSRALNTSKI
jgi:hypothetical protein